MKHKLQQHVCSWTTYVTRGFMKTIPPVTAEARLDPTGITILIGEIIHLIFFINGMFLPGVVRGTQTGPEFSITPLLQINKVTEKKIGFVFFLAYAFVGSFQPVDSSV